MFSCFCETISYPLPDMRVVLGDQHSGVAIQMACQKIGLGLRPEIGKQIGQEIGPTRRKRAEKKEIRGTSYVSAILSQFSGQTRRPKTLGASNWQVILVQNSCVFPG